MKRLSYRDKAAKVLRKSVLFITHGGQFGRLVPVCNAAALANVMAESLAATHDSAALIERAQDFSIDKATDRYLELLFP
jgi:hypothetical protein